GRRSGGEPCRGARRARVADEGAAIVAALGRRGPPRHPRLQGRDDAQRNARLPIRRGTARPARRRSAESAVRAAWRAVPTHTGHRRGAVDLPDGGASRDVGVGSPWAGELPLVGDRYRTPAAAETDAADVGPERERGE